MQVGVAFLGTPADARAMAEAAEAVGADLFLCGETDHTAVGCAMAAATATRRLVVGTAVSLAFARSPMVAAMEAAGLGSLAPGRAVYGVGSQVRQVVERRFGMPYGAPVARMAEYVEVMRRAAAAARGERQEPFEGRYYRVSQLTFHAAPDAALAAVPLYLGAVGPRMMELAAGAFDGMLGHGVATLSYLRERVRPAIGALPLVSAVMTSVDDDVDAARRRARGVVAFYGTTPAYEPAFEVEGRPDVPPELRRLFREGRRSEMSDLIDERLQEAFMLAGTPASIAARLRDYEGVLDGAILGGIGVGATQAEILANNRGIIEVIRAYRARSRLAPTPSRTPLDGGAMTDSAEAVIARQQVIDVLTRYATALDTRDWALLATCFTIDAVGDYRGFGGRREGYAAIEAGVRAALDGLDSSQHIVTNHVVEVDGDRARTTSYLHAQHFRKGTDGGDTFTVGATYTDILMRSEQGWRIAERRLDVSWTTGNRRVFAAARAGKPYPPVAMDAGS